MLFGKLQRVLTNGGGTPNEMVTAMRQAMLAVYGSQVGLFVIVAILTRFFIPARDTGWAGWFAGVAIFLFVLMSGFVQATQTKQDLATALKTSIFLGAVASIPAIFGLAIFALEGFSQGFWGLAALAGLLVAVASFQVTVLALQIPEKVLSVEPTIWPFGLGKLGSDIGKRSEE